MHCVLTIDFGSTYTKAAAIDVGEGVVLATAEDFTTAATDVSLGLEKALYKLHAQTGSLSYEAKLACSSAAGGLAMIACGLVPSLTAKAARFAAYGAGAKVIGTYAYELTEEDAAEIARCNPDILLLTGGTDGGNREVIEYNANVIAGIDAAFPVIIAGNRNAQAACAAILRQSGHPVYLADNVMPSLNELNVQPAQQIIREVFLERIILSKGLSEVQELTDGIMMPTPAAVLAALTLLAEGTKQYPGLGELMAVDLGGATTDIYSIAKGTPVSQATLLSGLREPYIKRTVEGDIGMRYGARGIVAAAGMDALEELSGLTSDEAEALLRRLEDDPSLLPETDREHAMDFALAALAVRTGMVRHAGTLREVYTPMGAVYQQTGKDLTGINLMILTGGALIHGNRSEEVVRAAIDINDPWKLIPRNPAIKKDTQYILASMGLLAGYDKEAAFRILNQTFGKDDDDGTC